MKNRVKSEDELRAIRDVNYFSLDLELNNLNNGQTPKIIQVGVAIGSPLRPDVSSMVTKSWFLDPGEPISPFITRLTGITDEVVQTQSVDHYTLAIELGDFLKMWDCFPNPVTWGQGDADELKAEFKDRRIDFPFFGRRIFDVKTLYVFQQMVAGKTPSGGLRKSMIAHGLKFEGNPHDARFDAMNTLRFFFYFLERQRKFEDFRCSLSTVR